MYQSDVDLLVGKFPNHLHVGCYSLNIAIKLDSASMASSSLVLPHQVAEVT
jgi:hypothetical protein